MKPGSQRSVTTIEHGESPTAIILAIAILITALLGSLTKLVQIIVILVLGKSR